MTFKIAETPALAQVDSAIARLLPVATTAAAAALSIQPIRLPGSAALAPAFLLMAVFHWAIYRPDLLSPPSVFVIGVAYDLITGGPPGATALVLLLARSAVLRYRRWFSDRAFPFIWGGFTLLTTVAMLGLWLMHLLFDGQIADFRAIVFRAMLTIALFPVASFLLGRAQRALMGAG
jgi:rod shape-determining protein MreD